MKRFFGLMFVAICVAAIPALDTAFAADPQGHYKLEVCHFSGGDFIGEILNISGRAVAAHLRNHGDATGEFINPMAENHCKMQWKVFLCDGGSITKVRSPAALDILASSDDACVLPREGLGNDDIGESCSCG